ncbi:MAG TPA: hypothetical protein VKD91_05065 [Pyrinomonadaceae bacterium]|nr:hypothetical protein [Pyrinomonadaceae bacterium]
MKAAFSFRNIISLFAVTLLLSSLTLAITFFRKSNPGSEASSPHPRLILWAWERPTDLRFIDTQRIGVAFLGRSILLKSDKVLVRPRLQTLQLPAGTKVIAVARIETDRPNAPDLSPAQRDVAARAIAELALPEVSEIQIDFDATQSQRNFYRDLIKEVRYRLSSHVRLSITALASWCMSDDWLADLPIDEAVPMLFRMAGDGKQIVTRLNAGDDFNAGPCRQSYGISLDEPRPELLPARKLFVFNPDPWTEKSVREISESMK